MNGKSGGGLGIVAFIAILLLVNALSYFFNWGFIVW